MKIGKKFSRLLFHEKNGEQNNRMNAGMMLLQHAHSFSQQIAHCIGRNAQLLCGFLPAQSLPGG